jgi:hypothetical protein
MHLVGGDNSQLEELGGGLPSVGEIGSPELFLFHPQSVLCAEEFAQFCNGVLHWYEKRDKRLSIALDFISTMCITSVVEVANLDVRRLYTK